ncbi:MAG: phosphate regulon transcriptional regulator PhoB [Gammaproteobacteria bacterium]
MTSKVLIVEDEPAIRQMLGFALAAEGFSFLEAGDVEAAQNAMKYLMPDIILLDWMLPGLSGVDFARRLKRDPSTSNIPIIMLTAKGEENDKVRGLDSGADDYITKPFSTRELLARVRAVMRRTQQPPDPEIFTVGPLTVDLQSNRVTCAGAPVNLSPTEFRLLHFFVTHPERVYSRSQLLDSVWGANAYIEERTVDVHIRRLRKLFEPYNCDVYIQTVRGMGYRFSTLID